jgi:replicative DNA helicase
MSEKRVGWRYDSNLCDIDSNKIFENKEAVDKKYKESTLGRLKIKFFPTNTASVQTLRSHVERLNLKGFDPDLIIIDYADIMRSSRQYDAPRHELKLIYEELRAFAAEKKIPIVTGSQANKEGSTNEIVDVTNMSEAYGKAHVADFVLGISRRAHEKVTGYGRIYIAKNRNGKDGIVFPVIIDTARSNFAVTGNAQLPEDAKSEDEQDVKKALRQKWQEVKDAMPLDQA